MYVCLFPGHVKNDDDDDEKTSDSCFVSDKMGFSPTDGYFLRQLIKLRRQFAFTSVIVHEVDRWTDRCTDTK